MKNLALYIGLFSLLGMSECFCFQTQYIISTPEPLVEVNTAELDEAIPMLSGDGSRIFFTRTNSRKPGVITSSPLHEIWYTDRKNNKIGTPVKAPKPLNTGLNAAVVGVNHRGNTIYLFGTYSKFREEQRGLSYSRFENNKWTKPRKIEIPGLKIEGNFYGIHVHGSEDVILISKGKEGNEDLYISLKDESGNWSEPQSLGPTINTSAFEISPFLTENKKYLFFSRGNANMDTDIYFTERLDDTWTNWSTPQRLEGPVNSTGFDAYFSMHSDSTIIFSSNRAGTNDIYMSKLVRKRQTEAELMAQTPETQDMALIAAETREETKSARPEQQIDADLLIEPTPVISKEAVTNHSNSLEIGTASNYIFFDFNASQISEDQKVVLDEIIGKLQDKPELNISITGHADELEIERRNKPLSEKRALEVRKYLIDKGITEQRIRFKAFGKLLPVANNLEAKGRSLNRRVEISWL